MNRILFLILCIFLVTGCDKKNAEDLVFLNLRIDGEEGFIPWESVEGSLNDSSFVLSAVGFLHKRCTLNITMPDSSNTIVIKGTNQFMYADGLIFDPDFAEGTVQLTVAGPNVMRGSFEVLLRDTGTNDEITVRGDFGYER